MHYYFVVSDSHFCVAFVWIEDRPGDDRRAQFLASTGRAIRAGSVDARSVRRNRTGTNRRRS